MRILIVSDLPQFVTGGAEMQAARLAEAWSATGHEVICVGRHMRGETVRLGAFDVPIKKIGTLSWGGRYLKAASYFFSLSVLLLQMRRSIDVVYVRFLGDAALTASVWRRLGLLSCPLVATPANTAGQGELTFLRRLPFSSALFRLLDSGCDAINLIAPAMREELLQAGFSESKLTFIPNGITPETLPPCTNQGTRYLVGVGRLAVQKGYDVLLRAVAYRREHFSPGQILIVGDGPERIRLTDQANQLEIADKITWLGERDATGVREVLDRAAVFLLPSRYEGLSNAGIEALERGLPIVLTRCGGLDRYVTPEIGRVVPVEDAEALGDAIIELLACDATQLVRMGERARELVLDTFDIRITSAAYCALFEQLRRKKI